MSGDATINSAGVFSLGNEKVTAAVLAKVAVEAQHLANLAVETGKLANNAVTAAKLAALAVTAEKIAAEAITESKIADGAVSPKKLKTLGTVAIEAEKMTLPESAVVNLATGGAATVKKIAVGVGGQLVTIIVNTGPITFKAAAEEGGLKLATESPAGYVAGEHDTLTLAYYSSIRRWVEVCRSNNF